MLTSHVISPDLALCFFLLNVQAEAITQVQVASSVLTTWVPEKMCCWSSSSSGASNQLLWFPLKEVCSPLWHTDRFVIGKRGDAGFSHEETSGLQWRVTENMGKESLKPCLQLIHQETNFLNFFQREVINLCTLCVGTEGGADCDPLKNSPRCYLLARKARTPCPCTLCHPCNLCALESLAILHVKFQTDWSLCKPGKLGKIFSQQEEEEQQEENSL